eukprot:TRINITY_DN5340_c2_g1_i1.p1 TRINITY_DN5340_c2_g1~~TRINITY_DN5340_c2_g1_i1.p1  ORF type:complete len:1424 (-),score=265.73 TRINITY_DN5340_c2_g1_i1:99-4370(-)
MNNDITPSTQPSVVTNSHLEIKPQTPSSYQFVVDSAPISTSGYQFIIDKPKEPQISPKTIVSKKEEDDDIENDILPELTDAFRLGISKTKMRRRHPYYIVHEDSGKTRSPTASPPLYPYYKFSADDDKSKVYIDPLSYYVKHVQYQNEKQPEKNENSTDRTDLNSPPRIDSNNVDWDVVLRLDLMDVPSVLEYARNKYQDHDIPWNDMFQYLLSGEIMSNFDERVQITKIEKLISEFVFDSLGTVKTLVYEKHLPVDSKTIKPDITLGGSAGGTKFRVGNKLFKFADRPTHMYEHNMEIAMKAASHEIRSLSELMNCHTPGIHFPLMALLTYCGHKILVSSIVPIKSKTTLIYGSSDQKEVIKNPYFAEIMKFLGTRLNLKEHIVIDRKTKERVSIMGPIDLEGHIGSDGRFYLIDTARLFPPEEGSGQEYLYRLLRPELVKRYPKPLSSDAFSPFVPYGDNSTEQDQEEIRAATKWLKQDIIPNFIEKINSGDIQIHSIDQIKHRVHQEGINLRYLGIIYKDIKVPSRIGLMFFCEMIARCFNKILLKNFSSAQGINDQIAKHIAVSNYNNLSKNEFCHDLAQDINRFYTLNLPTDIILEWKSSMKTEGENRADDGLIVSFVVHLQKMTGVKFSENEKVASIIFGSDNTSTGERIMLTVDEVVSIDVIPKTILATSPPSQEDLEQILRTQTQMFGEEDIRMVDTMTRLSRCYKNSCRFEDAKKILLRAKDVLNVNNKTMILPRIKTLMELAKLHDYFGRYSEALQIIFEAKTLMGEMLGLQVTYDDDQDETTDDTSLQHDKSNDNINNIDDRFSKLTLNTKLRENNLSLPKISITEPPFNSSSTNSTTTTISTSSSPSSSPSSTINPNNINVTVESPSSLRTSRGNQHSNLDIVTNQFKDNKHVQDGGLIWDIASFEGILCKKLAIYHEALTIHTALLQLCEDDAYRRVIVLDNLASVFAAQGQYSKAEEYYNQSLDMKKKMLGHSHPSTAHSISNLAELFQEQGKYEMAEQYCLESLKIRRETLGVTHPDYANSLYNLTEVYTALGQYDKAKEYCVQSLNIRKERLGYLHPDTAHSLFRWGCLFTIQCIYNKAEEYFQQSLNIRRETLGDVHPDTSASINGLGVLSFLQGNYSTAEQYYLQALDIRIKTLGESHPDTGSCKANLGVLYFTMCQYEKAEKFLLQALHIRMETLGTDHPDTAMSLNDLSELYKMLDKQKALKFCKQGLDILHKSLGNSHQLIATLLNNLASLYESLGDYKQAKKHYLQSLNITQDTLGELHPFTSASLNNLGLLYSSQGKDKKAEKYFKQSLDLFKKTLGDKHPNTASALNNLGSLYFRRQEYNLAKECFIQSLDIRQQTLGLQHPDTGTSLNNLAIVYKEQGDIEQAKQYFTQALNITRQTFGEAHPETSTFVQNLASFYSL